MDENETTADLEERGVSRRTVIKSTGSGTVGGAMLTAPATAHEPSADTKNDGRKMQTYVVLFEHTVEGQEKIEGVPRAVEESQPLLEKLDAEEQNIYFGSIGEYDGFGIVAFPSREHAEIFRLTLEQDRTHEFEVYRIWESEKYFGLIEQATS